MAGSGTDTEIILYEILTLLTYFLFNKTTGFEIISRSSEFHFGNITNSYK